MVCQSSGSCAFPDALNAWEISVDLDAIVAAENLFANSKLEEAFHELWAGSELHAQVRTDAGNAFFLKRMRKNWGSNLCWISPDDAATFKLLQNIFDRLRVTEWLETVVPCIRRLRMYTAQFLIRSCCTNSHMHVDYVPNVGTHALTLITPLRASQATDGFELVYQPERSSSTRTLEDLILDDIFEAAPPDLKQYKYKPGKAVVFGASFLHSTQPGRAVGTPHVYLCFCVGTDKMEIWPDITKTLGGQSRVFVDPEGIVMLTELGIEFEQRRRRHRPEHFPRINVCIESGDGAIIEEDDVQVIRTEFGFGLSSNREVVCGDSFFSEDPLVCIRQSDLIDLSLCEEVLGLPNTPRYAKIGLSMFRLGCLPEVLSFCQGDLGLFSPSLVAEFDESAQVMASHSISEEAEGNAVPVATCRQALIAFQSNAWHGPGEGSMSLYATLSRVNHSCAPNTSVGSHMDKVVLKAICSISAGEEITASYLSTEFLSQPIQERRQKLASGWGFWCQCNRCRHEGHEY